MGWEEERISGLDMHSLLQPCLSKIKIDAVKKIKIEPFIELSKAGYSQEKGREILYDRLFHVTMVLIDVFKTQSSQSNPETKKY